MNFHKHDLLKLAQWQMPFGKYKGTALIDLPEAYLIWFKNNGFPKGELGNLLAICLELKVEGLDYLVAPLKKIGSNNEFA